MSVMNDVYKDWQGWRSRTFDFEPKAEDPIEIENELSYLQAHLGDDIKPELDKSISETEFYINEYEFYVSSTKTRQRFHLIMSIITSIAATLNMIICLVYNVVKTNGHPTSQGLAPFLLIFFVFLLLFFINDSVVKTIESKIKQKKQAMDNAVEKAGCYALYSDYMTQRTNYLRLLINKKSGK